MNNILLWIDVNTNYLIWLAELAIFPIVISLIYRRQFDGVPSAPSGGIKRMNAVLFGIILYCVEVAVMLICLSVLLLYE